MNATEQRAWALKLSQALEAAGIQLCRRVIARGNVQSYEPIDATAAACRTIGEWMRWGWSVERRQVDRAQLTLLDGTVSTEEE